MEPCRCNVGLVFLLTVAVIVFARGDRPESAVDGLRRHNIALTTPALEVALQGSDPEVRTLAAQHLADVGTKEAIPFISAALHSESITRNQLILALSLARLGSEEGFTYLRNTCDNSALPGYTRMESAQYLIELGDEHCLNATFDVLEGRSDADSQVQALQLLPSFRHLSESDAQRRFNLLVKGLSSKSDLMRITAGEALVGLENISAAPYLQAAVAAERDGQVRSQLQADFARLQKNNAR
jgi:HEAT repeat protein